LVIAYNDIGVNYKDFDSIDKASEYFNKAMSIALEGKYLQDVLYPLSNIADIEIYHKEEYYLILPILKYIINRNI